MKEITIHTTRRADILAWCYLALEQTVLPYLILWLNTLLPQPLDGVELNFVLFCLNFVVTVLLFGKFLWRNALQFVNRPGSMLLKALTGFFTYLGANWVINFLIINLYPGFFNVNDQVIGTAFQQHYFLMALSTVVFAPVAEELLYRGLVFRVLYRKNPVLGYVVSVLFFSAIHVIGYIGKYDAIMLLVCFIQYIPASLVLAACYARTDCIFVPILIHMTINLIAIANMR